MQDELASGAPDAQPSSAVAPAPRDLLRAARGMTAVFWGLLLSLLLFSNAVHLQSYRLPVPSYMLGVALSFCGMLLLHGVTAPTAGWRGHIRSAMGVLLLHFYFAPFVVWWRKAPNVSYFVVNVMILLVCSIWLLLLINQLALDIAQMLRERTLRVEAEICGWSVVLLLLIPGLLFVLHPVVAALRHHSSVFIEIVALVQRIPRWMLVVFLMPFTLTLAVCWKTKEHCLRMLQGAAAGQGGQA